MDEDLGPDTITSQNASPISFGQRFKSRLRNIGRAFTTRDGLIGDYDYGFLLRPNLPFMKKSPYQAPFFGLNDKMPVALGMLLGLQHALAMLAGVITPPLILSGTGGANLSGPEQQYLVSTALIISGIMSIVQINRFRIPKTNYFVGTGVLSVVGVSFAIIPIAQGAFKQMYANGYCPTSDNGAPLPCPRGYGALIGTSSVCALTTVLISFIPPKMLQRLFPSIVTGPTVMLIGVKLIETGFKNWMGGSGPCYDPASNGKQADLFALCPDINAPHALPWGSPEYLGLGFSVFITILFCERFGSPIMKSTSVVWGLLVGCIIAAATGYFPKGGIDSAPAVSFVWLYTFPLSIYGPLVLPLIAVFVIIATEAIGDITASCDVSRIPFEGEVYESRIQGGLLTDGLISVAAGLMTMTPTSRFAQNNGVIALTRCANRKAGYACCFFLIMMGIFAKFAASLVAIPSSVLGGMTTFLFAAVAVSGMAIIYRGNSFDRRTRFILTAGLAMGYGATLVPNWFSNVFSYAGDNTALLGLLDAITLIMQTGFAVAAAVCMALNLTLPDEVDDDVDTTEHISSDSSCKQQGVVIDEVEESKTVT
ncbi:hypothetical protein V495_00867 [Pseudogymnoascus sp. VKM F-4514 (FW-929)]|nr:hypothetical protein V495_00867 [Pseudogymnoascus sp. VKM F-4514 (FW-929)]KFY67078.1 hypothetical protein V497_00570 [Pseudogymnoascus sp. VKM F-4516 (FW-969)]